ncbi:S-layer homology domain-containing protein [Citricoccus sp. NPDC055426]|uniref:S-layer homology domain-containing protein n=1 Tax=Citricoccus sp. NPDC055426 TaxID=3155536 RepID=UPI003420A2FA
MSRTLHPALKTGAATALALALTATTVMPATAMPVVPQATGLQAVSAPAEQPTVDPAVATGQEASEIKGAGEESLALGGIDAEALPEVADAAEVAPGQEPADGSAEQEAPVQAPVPTPVPETGAGEADTSDEPVPADEPDALNEDVTDEADTAVEAESEDAAASLMSLTVPASGPAGPAQKSAESGTQPSDVVIQNLQEKAQSAPATLEAPVAEEAEELTATVMDNALSTTRDVDVEKIATLTQPVETMDFIVAGVTWDIEDAGQVTEVSLRVREGSDWTDWNSMEIHAGDEMPNADRVGTEPLISSGADAIQVRITTVDGENPSGLALDLIDPGVAETDGKLQPASPASPALQQIEGAAGVATQEPVEAAAASTTGSGADSTEGAEFVPAVHEQQGLITGTAQATTVANQGNALKPAIITRAQWGANESVVNDWGTPSKDLKAMYVHHTAGSNNYTAAGAYAQIRGIFTYHAVNLAWGDIGYQFLVDKYGKIYQGRRGSIDAPVVGAQAGGFNTDTIGVSAMGNYDVTSAPAAMVRAIERVLAWQAHRYDVDPTANTRLTQSGKGTARWTSGTTVTVPTILGHKVTNSTACPGRYLDAQLPIIRQNVDRMVASAPDAPNAPTLPANHYDLKGPGLTATIRWNAVSGADHYQIMYRAQPHGGGSVNSQPWLGGRTTTGTRLDLGVDPGETAQFAVRAVRGGVAGPQKYLGQHTGAINPASSSVGTWAMDYLNSAGSPGGKTLRTQKVGSAVRIDNLVDADKFVFGAYASQYSTVAVTQNGRFLGTIRLSPGSQYCGVNLPSKTGSVRLESMDGRRVTYTSLAVQRGGHYGDLSKNGFSDCQRGFTDNPTGTDYYDAVSWMQWSGLSNGYANNTFGIRQDISRGESLAFVYRMIDPQGRVPSSTPFSDVKKGDTFFDPIAWAAAEKISTGYKNGTFGTNRDVTRGEFASMLFRAAKAKTNASKSFPDVAAGNPHRSAIAWLAQSGLSTGYDDGKFHPEWEITRGEVANILHRYKTM